MPTKSSVSSLPCRETDQLDGNVKQTSTGQREAVVSAATNTFHPQSYQEFKVFVGTISCLKWWSHGFFVVSSVRVVTLATEETEIKIFILHLHFELHKIKTYSSYSG